MATLLSKVLGSIFRIPLQNIAGDEVLGIFSLVYPVYMVALILSVAGIPVAISKLIAEARAESERHNTQNLYNQHTDSLSDSPRTPHSIQHIFQSAKILAILFGIISFATILLFSHEIAELLGGQQTRLALIVVSTTLLIAPYMAVYRGYFQGFDLMTPTGTSQVIEQFIRVGLILFLAHELTIRGQSNEIVAAGIMTASVAGATGSLVYLQLKKSRSRFNSTYQHAPLSFPTFKFWSKKILATSIPIAIGSITMALFNFVDSITIPFSFRAIGLTDNEITYQFGIYSRGVVLVQIVTVFASSIILPLIPLISKNLVENNLEGVHQPINKSFFLTQFLSWPAAVGLFVLAWPINKALFTNFEGSWVLAITGVSSVFTSLVIVATGVLQGLNKARLSAWVILAGVLAKFVLNIVLTSEFGLIGAAISTLIVYLIIFIFQWLFIAKIIPLPLFQWKIVSAAILMGGVIWLGTYLFQIENWSRWETLIFSAVATILGAGIYFLLTTVLKINGKK